MLRFPTPHWRDVIFDAGPNTNPKNAPDKDRTHPINIISEFDF